jgi:hypothetical protein
MIHMLYSEWYRLQIHTDSSLAVKNETVGALFSFYLSLEQFATHFGAEIEAVNTIIRTLW